ncbi:MAG: PTS system mannose/fructose/sorbose family transporter subunit IID [Anaerolineaceae bacterium]|nr:PTS system mannose/fructose/sorbose family transporter subunit IID [Anaerolineaceae bacterium]
METNLLGMAILVALLTWFNSAAAPMWLRWSTHFGAPLVAGLIYGIVLGNIPYGLAVGSSVMMVYMGLVAVGGSVPSDLSVAGYLGVAITMLAKQAPEVGLTIAVPLGTLGVLVQNTKMTTNAFWVHRADKYAAEGNTKGVMLMNVFASQIIPFLLLAIPSFLAVYYGAPALEKFLASVPSWVLGILKLAGRLLPALGLALLFQQIFNKRTLPFIVIGFIMAAYLNLPVMPISFIGIALAFLHYLYTTKKGIGEAPDEALESMEQADLAEPTTQRTLSKKTLTKAWFLWASFGQICYNFERMMGLGFTHSLNPIMEELYPDDLKRRGEAMSRNMAFYNTENTWGASIAGVVASMEEEKSAHPETNADLISSLKTALMGPIAGIGDSITQALVKVILLAIALSFSLQGNPLGVILFVLLFSAYALIVSHSVYFAGYRFGRKSIIDMLKGGRLQSVSEALSVVGMMVLGALISNNMNITTPLKFTIGQVTTEIQPILDSILSRFLNVAVFVLVYWMVKKGIKATTIIIIIFVAAAILSLLGVLA